jgi:hypothetical protein
MFDLKGVSSGLLLLGLLTLVLAVIAAARRRVQGCGVRLGLAAILAVLALAVVACGGAEVAQAVEAPLIREPHRGHIP